MSDTQKSETVDIDTGTIAEVPADQHIDVDEGDGANALVGGDDSDAAAGAFRNPGKFLLEIVSVNKAGDSLRTST